MKTLLSKPLPAWMTAAAIAFAIATSAIASFQRREIHFLEDAIRAREASVPGFLESTSVLSDRARCLRNPLISLKDRLLKADSCR